MPLYKRYLFALAILLFSSRKTRYLLSYPSFKCERIWPESDCIPDTNWNWLAADIVRPRETHRKQKQPKLDNKIKPRKCAEICFLNFVWIIATNANWKRWKSWLHRKVDTTFRMLEFDVISAYNHNFVIPVFDLFCTSLKLFISYSAHIMVMRTDRQHTSIMNVCNRYSIM